MAYTIDDYYKYDGYNSPAGYQAQDDIDWLSAEFDEFLKLIGCHRTPDSEWYYSCQHSGIHAVTDGDLPYYDPSEVDDFRNSDYLRIYNEAYPKMRMMRDWMDRVEPHLDNAPIHGWYDRTFYKKRDRRLDDRLQIVLNAFEELIEDTLEAICDAYEGELESACDYCFSDEAAEEWVKRMNEEAA